MSFHLWKRLGATGAALFSLSAINKVFNYLLAPGLIWIFGSVWGGILFFGACFILNYGIVVWYKRTAVDWFGMEKLRMEEEAQSDGFWGKLTRYFLRAIRPVAYVGLSIVDPTYGFIYLQGRRQGSRFTKNDWAWFILSNLIGVLVWVALVSGVLRVVTKSFDHLF